MVKLGLRELEEIRKGKRKFTRQEALSLVMGVIWSTKEVLLGPRIADNGWSSRPRLGGDQPQGQ